MSFLEKIRPPKGARKKPKRLGRGHSTGQGGTAGKGHKGQKARTGGSIRRGFEGGQTPIMRRLPKFGFNNKVFSRRPEELRTEKLNQLNQEGKIDLQVLQKVGLLRGSRVKIIAGGEVKTAVHFQVTETFRVSQGARALIEKAGGTVEVN